MTGGTSTRGLRGVLIAVVVAMAAGACKDDDGVCDGDAVRAALAAARRGEVVSVGACTLTGPIVVPEGVGLRGAGLGATSVVGPIDDGTGLPFAAIRVVPSDDPMAPTTVADLQVVSESPVAIAADGDAGHVRVERVRVLARRGVGLELVDVDGARLVEVTVEGRVPDDQVAARGSAYAEVAPYAPAIVEPGSAVECVAVVPDCSAPGDRRELTDPATGERFPQFCDGCRSWRTVIGTTGVLLDGLGVAVLERVSTRGMATHGVSWRARGTDGASTLTWNEGVVEDTLGVAVRIEGGIATLTSVSIDGVFQGARGQVPFGAYLLEGDGERDSPLDLQATGLQVIGSERFGVAQVRGEARFVDLDSSTHGDAGLWVGRARRFVLEGSDEPASIRDNAFAGLVVVDSAAVAVRNVRIEGTRELRARGSGTRYGTVTLGDGVQVFGSRDDVRFEDVVARNNERAQLAVDLGEDPWDGNDVCGDGSGLCFSNVVVEAAPGQSGAFAGDQRAATAEPAVFETLQVGVGVWDTGIERIGEAASADDVRGTRRALVGASAPSIAPAPVLVTGPID